MRQTETSKIEDIMVDALRKQKVDKAIRLDMEIRKQTKALDALKADLQAAALGEMENRNVKYVEFFGNYGSCFFGHKEKFEVDNLPALKQLLGDVCEGKIKAEETVKITVDTKLKQALTVLYKGDYQHHDIQAILQGLELDEKQIKAARKKLKGDYWKDRAYLESLGAAGTLEEELDAIREQLNLELAERFVNLEQIDLEKLRKAVYVEDNLSAGLNYDAGVYDDDEAD